MVLRAFRLATLKAFMMVRTIAPDYQEHSFWVPRLAKLGAFCWQPLVSNFMQVFPCLAE